MSFFATVKWVENILYSAKNKQTEETVILHFQEYNEGGFPHFEVCILPKNNLCFDRSASFFFSRNIK